MKKEIRMPDVTVGLPVAGRNLSQFEAAVRSVFAQTFRNWELIILLDGVSDELAERTHEIHDPRVEVLTHSASQGLARGLNEITATARAPLLARLDGDDVMFPARLERQIRFMHAHPEVDVLASRAIIIDDESSLVGFLRDTPIPSSQAGFLAANSIAHPTVMMRTEWSKANPYDPRYLRGEDKELWFRAQPTSQYAKLDEPLMFYRIGRDPNPAKQRLSAQFDRMLLREAGPPTVGRLSTYYRLTQSLGRQCFYTFAAALRQGPLLYSRHHKPASAQLHAVAAEALTIASESDVPGWD